MGLYITEDDVIVRLVGKVRFTDDPDDENQMPFSLLRRLINEAEGQVEYDLSQRYEAPFQTIDGAAFSNLPERPTKEILRTLCELNAVMRVLETDFGKGTIVNGDAYAEKVEQRYHKILDRIMKRKRNDEMMGWQFPPLSGLKLSYFNTEADDGYAGMVLLTSRGDGDYPASQINDPSQSYVNASLDDLDG